MAERDLERAEVAKATSHVGEVEQELTLLREGQEQVRPSDFFFFIYFYIDQFIK